jgi:hypothetical protein
MHVPLVSSFGPLRRLAPVRASARSKLRLCRLLRRLAVAILASGSPGAFALAEGRTFMERAVILACAALAFGMLGSPLAAQQSAPQATQPPPEAEPLPPPPPFPPMPSARPSHRRVDIGNGHASRVRHRATPTRRTHAHHHQAAHKARPAAHFSRKTIRLCHGMNYRQIMRHSDCRTLMSQELATTAHHHATHHHKPAAHRARQHHSARRHKR